MNKPIKLYQRKMFRFDISSLKKSDLEKRIENFLLNYSDTSGQDTAILIKDYFSDFHPILHDFVRSLIVDVLGRYDKNKHSTHYLKAQALKSLKHHGSHTFDEDFIKSVPWDYEVTCDHEVYRLFVTKFTGFNNMTRDDLMHISFLPYRDENYDRNFSITKSHDGRFTNILPNDLFVNDALITSLSNYVGKAYYTAISIGERSKDYHYSTTLVRNAKEEKSIDYRHSIHYELSVFPTDQTRHTSANPIGIINMFKDEPYFLYQGNYYFAVYVDGMLIFRDDDGDQHFPVIYSQLLYFFGVFLDFIENRFSPKKIIQSFARLLFSI